MFQQFFGHLACDALHRHEGFRGRLREVLRILEARIDQRLRSRWADSFDFDELQEDLRAVYLRRLHVKETPLDPFVSRAQSERLRERLMRVVVAAEPRYDVSLRGPRLHVVGLDTRDLFSRYVGIV